MLKRLLLVDDDEDLLAVMRDLFEESGFEVLSRSRAGTVEEDLRAFKPDVVVLDVRLPDVNGGELAYRLKNQMQCKVPIILISANYNEAHRWRERTGAEAFIQKPFDFEVMLRTVEEHL